MVRAFLFDIGNVLLRFDFNLALQKLAADCDSAAEAILDMIEPVKATYESGGISRAQFQARVRGILKYTGTDQAFISAWEDIFTENIPMIELVESLRGRYPLFLLSNTSDIHRDYIFRRYPVFQAFDAGVYSYEVAASKPDRAIYEIAVQQLGIVPAQTFFIDDLLSNIQTALELGFRAHHYHHEDHSSLLKEIADAGVEI
jgi:HAD superfamily hydrolase (TIGR01549 family)